MSDVLKTHWLSAIECNHETKTDKSVCACGLWVSDPQPNVGEAVARWVEHVERGVGTTERHTLSREWYEERAKIEKGQDVMANAAASAPQTPSPSAPPRADEFTHAANELLRKLCREVFEDGIPVDKLPHAVDMVMTFAETYLASAPQTEPLNAETFAKTKWWPDIDWEKGRLCWDSTCEFAEAYATYREQMAAEVRAEKK